MLSHTLDKPNWLIKCTWPIHDENQAITGSSHRRGHQTCFYLQQEAYRHSQKRRYSEWMAERRTKRQASDISGQAVASPDIISRKIFCNSTSGQIHSWGLDTSRWLTYSIRIKVNKSNPASSHAIQYHKLSFHTAGCNVHNHEHNSTGTLLQFNYITDVFSLFLHSDSHCHYMRELRYDRLNFCESWFQLVLSER